MEEFGNEGFTENLDREEIYSKSVRAGKRTYFFDVKATKGDDLYLTITESKKRFGKDGRYFYEKHKIFLYKEDFEKFEEGLLEAVSEIKKLKSEENGRFYESEEDRARNDYSSDVTFEDI